VHPLFHQPIQMLTAPFSQNGYQGPTGAPVKIMANPNRGRGGFANGRGAGRGGFAGNKIAPSAPANEPGAASTPPPPPSDPAIVAVAQTPPAPAAGPQVAAAATTEPAAGSNGDFAPRGRGRGRGFPNPSFRGGRGFDRGRGGPRGFRGRGRGSFAAPGLPA
jgi:5'-3' exoribonuclease 1